MSVSDLKLDYDLQVGGYKFLPKTSFKTILNRIGNYISSLTSSVTTLEANARPYKVYTALITQASTSAPTVTVLENTLGGTLVWSRGDVGVYLATLSGAFLANKVWIGFTSNNSALNPAKFWYSISRNDNNSLVMLIGNESDTPSDSVLNGDYIEIRVYP